MMAGRMSGVPISSENPLGLSWHDSAWIPILNPTNIMDYFSERSNPFYDRTCNNEVVKMQRLSMDQLNNMTGVEYVLLHVQDPILYVVRKQHRHSPTHFTTLTDYYVIAGVVYQAPDLASVLNSRLLSAVHHLQSSFEESLSYSRYHPSKGYWWDFKANKPLGSLDRSVVAAGAAPPAPVVDPAAREEPSTLFQRQRVDMLLAELVRQFPLPAPANAQQAAPQTNGVNVKTEPGADVKPADGAPNGETPSVVIKQEPPDAPSGDQPPTPLGAALAHVKVEPTENMKPPPEKKPRIM